MVPNISISHPPLVNTDHIDKKTNNKYLWYTLLGIVIVLIIFSIIITFVKN
jgi:hypothetical protein